MSGDDPSPSQHTTVLLRPPAGGRKVAELMRDVLADDDDEPARPADESVTIIYHRRQPASRTRESEQPGDRILGFELLEKTSEDWLGSIWRTERAGPLAEKAAVQIIKQPVDVEDALSRFGSEWMTLKELNHPHIAAVFETGATSRRELCLAAELIRGHSITRHCDENRLSIRERLELFIPACHAIHQAHEKKLLHRDLRPGCILISESGNHSVPKITGFGVVRAIAREDERWLDIRLRAAERRPREIFPWISPEQAASQPHDVRSDVWSLGAILHELLAGEPPLGRDGMRGRTPQVLQAIRSLAPSRPSARLAALAPGELERRAAARGADAKDLTAQLRGALDAIVMKALATHPDDRHASAQELVDDLARHLRGEPAAAITSGKLGWLRRLLGC